MKLELVSLAICPYVHRATTMLNEKGIPFDVRYVDVKNKPEWFLAISPRGKVPVLVADGVPIFESIVIVEFLDETQPPRIMPDDALERARQRSWIEVTNDLFAAQYKLGAVATRDEYAAARDNLDAVLARFEDALKTPFFAGPTFGIVDIAAAPAFFRLAAMERLSGERFVDPAKHPKAAAWAQALAIRPSVVAGVPDTFAGLFEAFLREKGWFGRERLRAA